MVSKQEMKKFSILKLAEYGVFLPVLGFTLLGLYKTYGEDIVKDTARPVAEIVVDSVLTEKEQHYQNQEKTIKIIQNYMRLQNEELYEKAKSLEED